MTIFNSVIGGGSVKVPLNDISTLSVTAGDTEATIKWTDVGNLTVNGVLLNEWNATKLVRKVGSAPSDSSDGTLVVTETVADTYSSTGYTDTGLTNGTTYYYKAFSVGSNGLESGSNSESVVPAVQGWQPGANTLIYLPIDDTDTSSIVYDHSTNQTNFNWYGTASYETLSSGKRVATFTGSNGIYIDTALIQNSPFTVACYVNIDSSQQENEVDIFCEQNGYPCRGLPVAVFNQTDVCAFMGNNGSSWYGVNNRTTVPKQTRFSLIITHENSTLKTYINGSLTQSVSGNISLASILSTSRGFCRRRGDGNNDRYLKGKIGSMIIEDKGWTAQEAADYHNQTKGDYGIS